MWVNAIWPGAKPDNAVRVPVGLREHRKGVGMCRDDPHDPLRVDALTDPPERSGRAWGGVAPQANNDQLPRDRIRKTNIPARRRYALYGPRLAMWHLGLNADRDAIA